MLEWLTGVSRPPSGVEPFADADGLKLDEAPETPAHVFAVRAFKSALFGTPAPDRYEDEVNDTRPANGEQAKIGALKTLREGLTLQAPSSPEKIEVFSEKPKMDGFASPARGILLTPGTGATRRKTVSFSNLVAPQLIARKDSKEPPERSHTTNDDESGSMSPAVRRKDRSGPRSPAELSRSLFDTQTKRADTEQTGYSDAQQRRSKPTVESNELQSIARQAVEEGAVANVDVTVDLKDPRSKSGQYWKREHQKYQRRSREEMRKLIKFNQNTKCFAAKRDLEATILGEKLKTALCRVTDMEARISNLASQLVSHETSNQEDLLTELAHQTALSLRYKRKAEKYEKAIQERNMAVFSDNEIPEEDAPQIAKIPPTTTSTNAVSEVFSLRSELENIRSVAAKAEVKAAELESENVTLKHTLARVKKEMHAFEIRNKVREERRRRRDEKYESLKRLLVETRADHEREILEYKISNPEGATRKGAWIAPERTGTCKDWKSQAENYELNPLVGAHSSDIPGKPQAISNENNSILQSSSDIWTSSAKQSQTIHHTAARETAHVKMEPSLKVIKKVLSEINQNEMQDRRKEVRKPTTDSEQAPDVQDVEKAAKISLYPRSDVLPEAVYTISNQDSYTSAPVEQSLRRSMTSSSVASNPQNGLILETTMIPIRMTETVRTGDLYNPSSRLSSLSGRPPLPPDRAAAAKLRLQQRNAEKARVEREGKENVKSYGR